MGGRQRLRRRLRRRMLRGEHPGLSRPSVITDCVAFLETPGLCSSAFVIQTRLHFLAISRLVTQWLAHQRKCTLTTRTDVYCLCGGQCLRFSTPLFSPPFGPSPSWPGQPGPGRRDWANGARASAKTNRYILRCRFCTPPPLTMKPTARPKCFTTGVFDAHPLPHHPHLHLSCQQDSCIPLRSSRILGSRAIVMSFLYGHG